MFLSSNLEDLPIQFHVKPAMVAHLPLKYVFCKRPKIGDPRNVASGIDVGHQTALPTNRLEQ